jgi:hypothetical protein
MTRARIQCRVPCCPRWSWPRVIQTQTGPITDNEVLCLDHWRIIPIRFRRVYRRARQAFFAETTKTNAERCNRLWQWLVRASIERSVGI